jgi:hypothetical protein
MPGTDGIMHDDVKCYNCNFKGHYANDCPINAFIDGTTPAVQLLQTSATDDGPHEPYESAFSFMQLGSEANTTEGFLFTQAANGYDIIPHS